MRKQTRETLGMLLPWACGILLLVLLPMAGALALSMMKIDIDRSGSGKTYTWVGLQHYRKAWGIGNADHTAEPSGASTHRRSSDRDPLFFKALGNSLFYTLFSVPLNLLAALMVAHLLHQPVRGAPVFRAMVYLPHVLGGVATAMIWSWLLNPQFGWVNEGIRLVYAALDPIVRMFHAAGTTGWPLPNWFYSEAGCKPALILMAAWSFGASMLIFLAALHGLPPSLYEAARLDGARPWRQFTHITLPQITPAILFNLIFGIIFAMQSFTEAYLLINRQQNDGLLFYVLHLYRTAFEPPYQLGYASALGCMLLLIILVMVAPLLWSAKRWVFYREIA